LHLVTKSVKDLFFSSAPTPVKPLMCCLHYYCEKKNVLSNRPKMEMVWTGSCRCFTSELPIIT